MSTRQLPMVQVSFFVGISSIYQCTAVKESSSNFGFGEKLGGSLFYMN
jgi:hypothetical protein